MCKAISLTKSMKEVLEYNNIKRSLNDYNCNVKICYDCNNDICKSCDHIDYCLCNDCANIFNCSSCEKSFCTKCTIPFCTTSGIYCIICATNKNI